MKAGSLKRRIISVIMLAVLLSGLVCAPAKAASGEVYSDDRWGNGVYASTLGDMAGRRLYVYGIADSFTEAKNDKELTFHAEKSAGRLTVALLLYRAFGEPVEVECPFSDVPEEYREAVNWLYAAGITKGVAADLYGSGNMTEYHFLIMLSRLLGWGTESEAQLFTKAESLGLAPVDGVEGDFTLGEAYQTLCAMLDRLFPERKRAARAEMSTPDAITVLAGSYEEAVSKIKAAVMYLPNKVFVEFTEKCPEEDLAEFCLHFDWLNGDKRLPIIGVVNQLFIGSYWFNIVSDRCCRLIISNYASGHMACTDTSGWLRVYADEKYRAKLRAFAEQYILPLTGLSSQYEQAARAHDLLCKKASYDYDYVRQTEQKKPARWEAHEIMGFMENGKVVCDGYACVYQWMLTCCGIESYIVTGKVNGSDLHAWNRLCIDGKWYNTDVCWDDTGGVLRQYYMRTDSWFSSHQHTFTDKYSTTAFPSL